MNFIVNNPCFTSINHINSFSWTTKNLIIYNKSFNGAHASKSNISFEVIWYFVFFNRSWWSFYKQYPLFHFYNLIFIYFIKVKYLLFLVIKFPLIEIDAFLSAEIPAFEFSAINGLSIMEVKLFFPSHKIPFKPLLETSFLYITPYCLLLVKKT